MRWQNYAEFIHFIYLTFFFFQSLMTHPNAIITLLDLLFREVWRTITNLFRVLTLVQFSKMKTISNKFWFRQINFLTNWSIHKQLRWKERERSSNDSSCSTCIHNSRLNNGTHKRFSLFKFSVWQLILNNCFITHTFRVRHRTFHIFLLEWKIYLNLEKWQKSFNFEITYHVKLNHVHWRDGTRLDITDKESWTS